MATTSGKTTIGLEEGWGTLQPDIDRLIALCEEGWPDAKAPTDKQLSNYSLVYNMSVQRPPNNHCQQLYERYTAVYVDYLASAVLPKLRQLSGCALIREVGRRWADYLVLSKHLRQCFTYLDIFYTKREKLPNLRDVSVNAFRDAVLPLVQHHREAVVRGDDGDAAECDWDGLRALFGVTEGELTTAEELEPEPEPELTTAEEAVPPDQAILQEASAP